jgi:DnaJ-class molecular chaperone
MELPVSLAEAVLGGKLDVPTPTGPVRMSVPTGSNTGTRLRLKGKGAAQPGGGHGDAYVTLKIVLPDGRDEALETFLRGWQAGQQHNPREAMER